MSAVRAADLPVGSIVATADAAHIKTNRHAWACSDGTGGSNGWIDYWIAERGARVLRVGDGQEAR